MKQLHSCKIIKAVDWKKNLKGLKESRTSGVGLGQRSRFLVLTKRSAASGDEIDNVYKHTGSETAQYGLEIIFKMFTLSSFRWLFRQD